MLKIDYENKLKEFEKLLTNSSTTVNELQHILNKKK